MYDLHFFVLDDNYNVVGTYVPANVQWNRRYYESGDFTLQIPYEQYINNGKFIFSREQNELGMIQKVHFNVQNNFKSILVSGCFLENELNDKIIHPSFTGRGTHVSDVIKDMVRQYKADIPLLTVAENDGQGTATEFQSEQGIGLGEQARRILQLHQMAYKVTYDYVNNEKVFDVWQGLDCTHEQSVNPFVTFSTNFGNLTRPDVIEDFANFKNYIVVQGEVNDKPVFVTYDASNGGYKKQTFIEATGIQYDEEEMTLSEYKTMLKEFGKQTLNEQYQIVQNIQFDLLENGYIYKKDFDLGTKCDIIIDEINLTMTARIVAIYEVFKDNAQFLTLEVGNLQIK